MRGRAQRLRRARAGGQAVVKRAPPQHGRPCLVDSTVRLELGQRQMVCVHGAVSMHPSALMRGYSHTLRYCWAHVAACALSYVISMSRGREDMAIQPGRLHRRNLTSMQEPPPSIAATGWPSRSPSDLPMRGRRW
jgi:hypothetical protein